MTGSPDSATKPRNKRGSTRARMLGSAVEVLRERGAAGVTIDEVLARSGAPRGSVYHHFPGGRRQILMEALQFAADTIGDVVGAETSGRYGFNSNAGKSSWEGRVCCFHGRG